MFGLKEWSFDPTTIKRPSIIGRYTNDVVYERLTRGVLTKLQKRNPVTSKDFGVKRHHQWLTGDIGHPKLKEHIIGVIALMRAYANWGKFKNILQRSYPKKCDTLQIDFKDED